MEQLNDSGRVGLEDIARVVGESDPGKLSAKSVRDAIGRGSYGTIQKHLETLRSRWLDALKPSDSASIPPLPTDAMGAVWAAAYGAAEVAVRRRMEALASDRDRFLAELESARNDVAQAVKAVDDQEALMNDVLVASGQTEAESERRRQLAEDLCAQLEKQVEELTAAAVRDEESWRQQRHQANQEHRAAVEALQQVVSAAGAREGLVHGELVDAQRQNGALSERIKTLEATIQSLQAAAQERQ